MGPSMDGHGQLTVYRDCIPVVDGWYTEDDSQSIVETVTSALATAEDVDVIDLPPLYDSIDMEALEKLFQDHDGASDSGAILSFQYSKWNVFVRADGRVRICDGTKQADTAPVFAGETS